MVGICGVKDRIPRKNAADAEGPAVIVPAQTGIVSRNDGSDDIFAIPGRRDLETGRYPVDGPLAGHRDRRDRDLCVIVQLVHEIVAGCVLGQRILGKGRYLDHRRFSRLQLDHLKGCGLGVEEIRENHVAFEIGLRRAQVWHRVVGVGIGDEGEIDPLTLVDHLVVHPECVRSGGLAGVNRITGIHGLPLRGVGRRPPRRDDADLALAIGDLTVAEHDEQVLPGWRVLQVEGQIAACRDIQDTRQIDSLVRARYLAMRYGLELHRPDFRGQIVGACLQIDRKDDIPVLIDTIDDVIRRCVREQVDRPAIDRCQRGVCAVAEVVRARIICGKTVA